MDSQKKISGTNKEIQWQILTNIDFDIKTISNQFKKIKTVINTTFFLISILSITILWFLFFVDDPQNFFNDEPFMSIAAIITFSLIPFFILTYINSQIFANIIRKKILSNIDREKHIYVKFLTTIMPKSTLQEKLGYYYLHNIKCSVCGIELIINKKRLGSEIRCDKCNSSLFVPQNHRCDCGRIAKFGLVMRKKHKSDLKDRHVEAGAMMGGITGAAVGTITGSVAKGVSDIGGYAINKLLEVQGQRFFCKECDKYWGMALPESKFSDLWNNAISYFEERIRTGEIELGYKTNPNVYSDESEFSKYRFI